MTSPTPGTFVAVHGNNEWHEVLVLGQQAGGKWWCFTIKDHVQPMYNALQLVEGHFIAASDQSESRCYPGLGDLDVNWLIDWDACGEEKSTLWVPDEKLKTELAQASHDLAQLTLSEEAYFRAGGVGQQFVDLAELACLQVYNTLTDVTQITGRFAIIKRGNAWVEVFLLLQVGSDPSKWLCLSSNSVTEYWVAVQLTPGAFMIAAGTSSDRRYPTVPSMRVWWMYVGHGEHLVSVGDSDIHQRMEDAKQILKELGSIPDHLFCQAGSKLAELPGIKEMLQTRLDPVPGRFALVQRKDGEWTEVLLCTPHIHADCWLCLAQAASGAVPRFMFTAVKLQQDSYAVLEDMGENRHDRINFPAKLAHLRTLPSGDSLWTPTPQRVRKALAGAKKVASVIGAQFNCAVAGPSEDEAFPVIVWESEV